MIKTAIVGYGQMGKQIELLNQNQLEIVNIFDIDNPIDRTKKYDFSTAIEFTNPSVVFNNIKKLAKMGKNIVCGTTGWENKIDLVKDIVEKNNVGFVYATNFSIGMRLFFKIIESSVSIFNDYPEYDIMLHELHHKRKVDSPSGTALSLGDIILNNSKTKNNIITDKVTSKISENDLHISSTRGGEIPGTHTLFLDSTSDSIEIKHQLRNRDGLALGAIKAAELIEGKKGFFEFGELL